MWNKGPSQICIQMSDNVDGEFMHHHQSNPELITGCNGMIVITESLSFACKSDTELLVSNLHVQQKIEFHHENNKSHRKCYLVWT